MCSVSTTGYPRPRNTRIFFPHQVSHSLTKDSSGAKVALTHDTMTELSKLGNFEALLASLDFADVTLVVEGKQLKAHKFLLSGEFLE